MGAGDRIIIHTPGGGGWGKAGDTREGVGAPINGRNASARMVPVLTDSAAVHKGELDGGKSGAHDALHTTRTMGSVAEWSSLQLGA